MDDLYCKILVDFNGSQESLIHEIATMANGVPEGFTIATNWAEIDVMHNDDFNQSKCAGEPDEFLFYRYYIDMELLEGISRESYIAGISDLLSSLWGKGMKAVAACDFEGELPQKGGYGA